MIFVAAGKEITGNPVPRVFVVDVVVAVVVAGFSGSVMICTPCS
jgi:hypothetical protein